MLDKRTDASSAMPTDHSNLEGMSNAEVPPEAGGDLPF